MEKFLDFSINDGQICGGEVAADSVIVYTYDRDIKLEKDGEDTVISRQCDEAVGFNLWFRLYGTHVEFDRATAFISQLNHDAELCYEREFGGLRGD